MQFLFRSASVRDGLCSGQADTHFLNRSQFSSMSADPPSSSGLPPRTRPVLSDLSKQTTEEDLWDLDEEATPANVPGPAGENPGAVPQTPSIKEKPKP